ncbi:hypothetical protein HLRTI_000660 [Halorhabdus tiamatea SARL4B]|uniref:DUF3368 domain-containing protein n=1 Tax=Halorhabdus tiamatea SARL4B TaxID=1033806 RepID=F7PFX8_9EURY|nr:hypothetical protein [Halorhabdus tiamatea]ERJ07302.1 hypothetical protein HLRTI_000660 [Halorhabdus tiamatea SARL4B]CCQ34212.1 conserved hypothetical protein [Halorhabdus tiamatea SARL4B]
MIVADTSALVSLASIDRLDLLLAEFDVHTTETVVSELQETADYADSHGRAAQAVLDRKDDLTVNAVGEPIETGRIDAGEGSGAVLARERDAAFLITDDLRALPELQAVTEARIAISPIVLRALVKRDVLDVEDALADVERLAAERDWLGAPIYRRARELFEE